MDDGKRKKGKRGKGDRGKKENAGECAMDLHHLKVHLGGRGVRIVKH